MNENKISVLYVVFIVIVLVGSFTMYTHLYNVGESNVKSEYYEGYRDGWDDAIMTYGIAKVYESDDIPEDVKFTLSNGEKVRIVKRIDYAQSTEVWLELPEIKNNNITTVFMYWENTSPPEGWDDAMWKRVINFE